MTMTMYMSGRRTAIIKARDNGYIVWFKYDSLNDYEWKRGSHGIPCDTCKTLASAIKKARRYVGKSNMDINVYHC